MRTATFQGSLFTNPLTLTGLNPQPLPPRWTGGLGSLPSLQR